MFEKIANRRILKHNKEKNSYNVHLEIFSRQLKNMNPYVFVMWIPPFYV